MLEIAQARPPPGDRPWIFIWELEVFRFIIRNTKKIGRIFYKFVRNRTDNYIIRVFLMYLGFLISFNS